MFFIYGCIFHMLWSMPSFNQVIFSPDYFLGYTLKWFTPSPFSRLQEVGPFIFSQKFYTLKGHNWSVLRGEMRWYLCYFLSLFFMFLFWGLRPWPNDQILFVKHLKLAYWAKSFTVWPLCWRLVVQHFCLCQAIANVSSKNIVKRFQ